MGNRIGRQTVRKIMACAAAAVLAACMMTGCGKKPAETTAAPASTAAAQTETAAETAKAETSAAETTAAETTQAETTAAETSEAPAEKAEPGTPEAAEELAKDVWYAIFGGAVIPDAGSFYDSKSLNGASRQVFLSLAVAESGAYTGAEKKEAGIYTIGKQEAEKLLTGTIGMDPADAAALVAAQEEEGDSIVLYSGDWGTASPFIEAEAADDGTVKGKMGFEVGAGKTIYDFTMVLADSDDSPFGYAFESLDVASAAVDPGNPAGDSAPEFVYVGTDAAERAACEEILIDAEQYFDTELIQIPSPRILYVDDADPEDVKVFGYFNIDGYKAEGKVLKAESGARQPGVMHMKESYGRYTVTSYEKAVDGAGNEESIREFCKGYDGLADRFFQEADDEGTARKAFTRMYVLENCLDVESYQDYGWDPVELF